MLHPYFIKLLFPPENKINWFHIFAPPCNMLHIFVSKLICSLLFMHSSVCWFGDLVIYLQFNIMIKLVIFKYWLVHYFSSSWLLCGESGVWRTHYQWNGRSIVCELGSSCPVRSSTGKLLLYDHLSFIPQHPDGNECSDELFM